MTSRAIPWRAGGPLIWPWALEDGEPSSLASSLPEETRTDGADWEAKCIRETLSGRPDHFNPLVTHYAPRIRAYLYRMLRDREEAEDLTQETFIKAFRALARFKAEASFRSWLYAIATNTGLNALRTRKRRGVAVELDEERHGVPCRAAVRDKGGDQPSREEALELALVQLPPRAARVVALHYQEGFSLAEAGDVLGLTENAAKVALCRARKQLREYMVKGGGDGR